MIRVRRLTLILNQTVGEVVSQRDLSAGHNHADQNERSQIKKMSCFKSQKLARANSLLLTLLSINGQHKPSALAPSPTLLLRSAFFFILPSVCSSASCILESTLKPFVLDPTHCWKRHLGGTEPSAEPLTRIIKGFPSADSERRTKHFRHIRVSACGFTADARMAAVNPLLSIIVTVAADWSHTSPSNQWRGITACAHAPVATLNPQKRVINVPASTRSQSEFHCFCDWSK